MTIDVFAWRAQNRVRWGRGIGTSSDPGVTDQAEPLLHVCLEASGQEMRHILQARLRVESMSKCRCRIQLH